MRSRPRSTRPLSSSGLKGQVAEDTDAATDTEVDCNMPLPEVYSATIWC